MPMAATMIAYRFVVARSALRAASSAAECLPAIAAMIEVASDLRRAGDDGAARAHVLLGESIRYLRAAVAGLSASGEERLLALYLLSEAALSRDSDDGPVCDLDDAVANMRLLRAAFTAGTPDRAEIDAKLGGALFARGCKAGGRIADLDEAGVLLESVFAGLAPGDPGRHPVAAVLAAQRAFRYVLYGGTEADRDAALAFARMCLGAAAEGGAGDATSTGHVVTAWMALTRQLTAAQRSVFAMSESIEAARSNARAAASLLARLGKYEIAPDDAATAITHLRQVPESSANVALRDFVPLLWGMALLAVAQADGSSLSADLAADALRVADDLGDVASAVRDEPQRRELLAMRAVLLALRAKESSTQARVTAADALSEAASGLPAGHLLRSPVLDVLGDALGRRVTEAKSSGDVAAQLADVADAMDRMPRDDPGFARALTAVGVQMLSASTADRAVFQQEWLVSRLEALTSGLDPDDPLLPAAQFMQWSGRLSHATMRHRPETADAIIEKLTRYADSVPASYEARPYMLAGAGLAYVERHAMGGELRHLEQAEHFMARAIAEADPTGPFGESGPFHGVLLYFRGHLRLVRYYYDRDPRWLNAAIGDLERARSVQEYDQTLSSGIVSALETARAMRDGLAQGEHTMALGAEARDAFDGLLRLARQVGREDLQYPTIVAQAASGLVLRGLSDHDITLIDQAIRMLADAANVEGLAVRERPRLLELHGQGLLTRYSLTRVPADLSNAIDRLEEARRAVEQEAGSPHAASVLQTLASAYRTRANAARGDVDRAVALGLAGLREHAGDVFLQDNDDNALHIAQRGTSGAAEMARWFLAHDREEAAVSALELGRGMVVHAATSGAGVEQVLRDAGHVGLADEWAAQAARPGQADAGSGDDLRYRVMLAIERSPAETRLLSPPAVADIAAALTVTGTDALAYLLPRDDEGAGLAVVVAADGAVRRLPLPGLYTGGGSPVGALLRARRSVEAAGTDADTDTARKAWLDVLGTVCDWAWQAAVGPLLGAVPARGGKARRIVLVPAAELGLVPWHAARQPGTGTYACQHAIFSYATSARQFAEAAKCDPRRWAQAPVLISDAAESLYLTAAGIAHLHAAHYQMAAVYGFARYWLADTVPGTPAATCEDVLGALPRVGFPGASLLHFGCHGRVQVPVLGSSITLGRSDKGERETVEVRDILRQARAWQGREPAMNDAGGLVVLASCLTDVTERDFDEALTLAAAFLAAGAASVVGARWTVADAVTALFMNVFHQCLNDSSCPQPAHALRAAQLWMLNPDREVPDSWPRVLREEAALAGGPGGPELASPGAWAAFTYQGR
jgi:hypothetical protein